MKLAKFVANIASNKKANDIVILDMRKVANFCDFFVICTGNSSRQIRAIAEGIEEELKKFSEKVLFTQGLKDGLWVVLDLGSVVAHVFDVETREFYGLEYLWQEAKKVKWNK